MAAADEAELAHMVHTMALHDTGPIAVRYPRGNGVGVAMPETPEPLEIGKGRIVREGKKVAILSLGTRLAEALKAADVLEGKGLSTTVADLRFAKPLDEELIRRLLATHEVAVTVEEASIGGFGAHVLTLASDAGLIDAGLKLRTMRLPDRFQDQDKPEKQYAEAGLDADGDRRDGAEGAAPQQRGSGRGRAGLSGTQKSNRNLSNRCLSFKNRNYDPPVYQDHRIYPQESISRAREFATAAACAV